MIHYLMLCYFNVRLVDNALVAVAVVPVTLVVVTHDLMLHYFNDVLVVVALFNVALFDVALS